MKKSGKMPWGFNAKDLNIKVRPQDDFYHYANGGWIKRNPIPADESRWGSFTILRHTTEKQLKNILAGSDRGLIRTERGKNAEVWLVKDFYRSGMEMKRREKLGAKPISELRADITKL